MAKAKRLGIILLVVILFFAALLRFWKLDQVPVALFGDEIDAGYHAYSLVKTGRDYQGNFMPLHFHSLAEWRTPLFIYSLVPSVAIFGVTPWGVRLPAAIFGVLSILGLYLLLGLFTKGNRHGQQVALVGAFVMAISPWHVQYSRAGFEVTMLLTFVIFALYFFLQSLDNKGKLLWLGVTLLTFSPWIYSTAKLFIPLLFIFLFLNYKKEILALPKKAILHTVLAASLVGLPILYSTIFGGGTQRALYTSVFTDLTVESEVGYARSLDSASHGGASLGTTPRFLDRLFHNKITFWYDRISGNYLGAFSTNFLFVEGDPNLRHSPKGIGQFYRIEFFTLLAGLVFFFSGTTSKKTKYLLVFWLLVGVLPSALTRDGGNHATRLILILPPLIILITYGLFTFFDLLQSIKLKASLLSIYVIILFQQFVFYGHNYLVHYPRDSERWWHFGFKESFEEIANIQKNFDRVIISMAGEPAWIFFGGLSQFPPEHWQKEFPINNKTNLAGFGEVSHIGKYYFAAVPESVGVYGLPKIIDNKTLYMAVAKEIGANLLKEPGRTPPGLKLLKVVAYPSGDPAFYLFTAL